MPERLHSTSSVPDFSTYPEEPTAAAPNLEATYATYRRYSEGGFIDENALSNAAARLGNAVGSAVSRIRDAVWQARSRLHGARNSVRSGQALDFRARARQIAQDEPLKVILAAGALGLIVGAGIRVWREND